MRIHVAGIDLIRDELGEFRVLEDNLRCPSGVSYVLENRRAMSRVLPEVFAGHRVRAVAEYPERLLDALRAAAPRGVADPTVVVLTPGVHNSAHFEHAFLARRMGVELVEGRDLYVRDDQVWMRTTRGPSPVHVLYRRIDDDFLDPVHFRPDSVLGVPGVLNAARAGRVGIANAIGNGVADDKAVYPYVPDLIEYYLGEEAILPNVETYDLQDADQLAYVLERLDRMVIKPVDGSGGYGLLIGARASDAELAAAAAQVTADPRGWIAQPLITFSTCPTCRRLRRGAASRGPATVRGERRRAHLRAARGAHPGRAAREQPGGELLAGRRVQGHLGAGGRRRRRAGARRSRCRCRA